ncbi:MAG: hypothetical protein AAF368_12440, partial [Planctomycetota bacterium]
LRRDSNRDLWRPIRRRDEQSDRTATRRRRPTRRALDCHRALLPGGKSHYRHTAKYEIAAKDAELAK